MIFSLRRSVGYEAIDEKVWISIIQPADIHGSGRSLLTEDSREMITLSVPFQLRDLISK